MTLNGSLISAAVADPTDLTALMGAINGAQGATGVTASFTSAAAKNSLTLSTTDGRDIKVLDFNNTGATKTAVFSGVTLTGGAATDSSIKSGYVTLESSKGAITLAGANLDAFTSATQASAFSALNAISLTGSSGANSTSALAVVDAALAQINTRGALGAYQNRFSSAIASLQTTSENLSAARSRILDTDFAMETANLTRTQILQQAGTAMSPSERHPQQRPDAVAWLKSRRPAGREAPAVPVPGAGGFCTRGRRGSGSLAAHHDHRFQRRSRC
jgi:flagellin